MIFYVTCSRREDFLEYTSQQIEGKKLNVFEIRMLTLDSLGCESLLLDLLRMYLAVTLPFQVIFLFPFF